MFNHETVDIIPVIKDLTTKDMSSNTPAELVSFLLEVLMTQELSVEIVNFEGAVVDVDGWLLLTEERMVVDEVVTAIEMEETGDVLVVGGE